MIDLVATVLAGRGAVVLDGGLATELERRGADLRDPLWSARVLLDDPDLVREVHRSYFEAGAGVAISSSYQASFEGFEARGLDRDRTARLLRRSVELAAEAREDWMQQHGDTGGPPLLVAASIGPYGAVLANGAEYTGDYGKTADELLRWHLPRMEVLAAAGADLLAIETIPSVVEAEALASALASFPEVPAWISFSCRDGGHICDGTPFGHAIEVAAAPPNVVAVGLNCTAPIHVGPLVEIAASTTDKPVVAYPNRGAFWDPLRRTWMDPPRQDAAPSLRPAEWFAAGARLIGGCCGTGPDDISAIATALRA
ncbi:MAG TPA: homocysteine S-methyltransferase [Actinomycetota bacterium]